MALASAIIGLLVPKAFAVTLEQLGEGVWGTAPGVGEMWESILGLFPFSGEGAEGPQALLDTINTAILAIIALVAVGLVVFAGVRLMAAGGNEEGLTEARRILKNVAIGLICALLADVAIMYVADFIMQAAGGGGG